MTKLNRFLLAEDPRNEDGGLAIIHTIEPQSIIQIIEGNQQLGEYFRQFTYTNPDGVDENYTLVIRHMFTTNMNNADDDVARQSVDKLLNRAWHWYESYLKWEDNNIDLEDYAQEN